MRRVAQPSAFFAEAGAVTCRIERNKHGATLSRTSEKGWAQA
jgi:hypothetical protein